MRHPPRPSAGPSGLPSARPLPVPRHHTAYLLLRQRMDGMEANALLPGEHELAAELGMARITIRRALARLEDEGRVLRRRGDGTRVRERKSEAGDDFAAGTVAQLLQIGRRTTTEVLGLATVPAGPDVAEGLGLTTGAPVRRAQLLRKLHGMPVSHLSAFFPATPESRGITRAVLGARPLLAVTEELGGEVREVRQDITCVLADGPLATRLAVEVGAPLVRVVRRFVGRRGPLQFSIAHYRADCFTLQTVETRQGGAGRCEVAMRLGERDGAGGWPGTQARGRPA